MAWCQLPSRKALRDSASLMRKKFPKKRKKPESARTKLVQPIGSRNPYFESLVVRDSYFRFLTRTKQYLSQQQEQVIRLEDAGKLYHELGFSRGRKIGKFLLRHPLCFQTYRHDDGKMWLGFSSPMEDLLDEEKRILDSLEEDRVTKMRKLLMMSKDQRISLSKLHHCRLLFGFHNDLRDRVLKYPEYFRVVENSDGKRILELCSWDPSLEVSALERAFVHDEDATKKAFRFPVKHAKSLGLSIDDLEKLELLNTLPLVSPYGDAGKLLDVRSLEAEKYRLGVLHEFLSLTLEKKASIHHIVEFRDEFCLTKNTYDMLKRQYRTFYLAGTEMNWVVFLKNAYTSNGELIDKDPLVRFNEKLQKFALMKVDEYHSSLQS